LQVGSARLGGFVPDYVDPKHLLQLASPVGYAPGPHHHEDPDLTITDEGKMRHLLKDAY
jgi:hypothetical protein